MTATSERDAAHFRAMTFLEQGKHLYNARRYADALAAFEKALENDPSLTRAKTAQAHAKTALGRAGEAVVLCDDVIREDPDFPYAHSTRANALHKLGRVAEAQRSYERALAIAPDDSMVRYNAACFWAQVGREEQCRADLARALELNPRLNSMAAVDEDFAPVRGRDWFQNLTAFKR